VSLPSLFPQFFFSGLGELLSFLIFFFPDSQTGFEALAFFLSILLLTKCLFFRFANRMQVDSSFLSCRPFLCWLSGFPFKSFESPAFPNPVRRECKEALLLSAGLVFSPSFWLSVLTLTLILPFFFFDKVGRQRRESLFPPPFPFFCVHFSQLGPFPGAWSTSIFPTCFWAAPRILEQGEGFPLFSFAAAGLQAWTYLLLLLRYLADRRISPLLGPPFERVRLY